MTKKKLDVEDLEEDYGLDEPDLENETLEEDDWTKHEYEKILEEIDEMNEEYDTDNDFNHNLDYYYGDDDE